MRVKETEMGVMGYRGENLKAIVSTVWEINLFAFLQLRENLNTADIFQLHTNLQPAAA